MTQHEPTAPDQHDEGLSLAELEEQQITELPAREAMSLVNMVPTSSLIAPDPFPTVPTEQVPDGIEPGMNRPVYQPQDLES